LAHAPEHGGRYRCPKECERVVHAAQKHPTAFSAFKEAGRRTQTFLSQARKLNALVLDERNLIVGVMVKFLAATVLLALPLTASASQAAPSQRRSPPGKHANPSKSASDRRSLLSSLSLRDRVAQMIIVRGY